MTSNGKARPIWEKCQQLLAGNEAAEKDYDKSPRIK